MSLLHVQSARLAVEHDPADAARALAEAERLGRECLAEVRTTVGMLRRDAAAEGSGPGGVGGQASTAPLPGAGALPALVEQFRRRPPGGTMTGTAIRVLLVDDQELVRTGLRGIVRAAFGFDVVGECADGGEVMAAVDAVAPDVVLMDVRMPFVDGVQATLQLKRRESSLIRRLDRDEDLDMPTSRELEVLTLIGRGKTNGEIAAELFVSEGTVKTHINHLFTKLRLRDRAAAVIFAFDHSLVKRPG